jgi:hypothetical protein
LPITDIEAPSRANALRDKDAPTITKSKSAMDDPRRDTPRRAKELPMFAKSSTEMEEQIIAMPNTANAEQKRPKRRRARDDPT